MNEENVTEEGLHEYEVLVQVGLPMVRKVVRAADSEIAKQLAVYEMRRAYEEEEHLNPSERVYFYCAKVGELVPEDTAPEGGEDNEDNENPDGGESEGGVEP